MSKMIKSSSTTVFLKAFIVLELFLILFCGSLGVWLAYFYHQNKNDQERKQIQELSQILYSNVEKNIQKYQFDSKLFSQKIKSMMDDINKIKTIFLLDSGDIILYHQNESMVGEHVRSVYPKLKLAKNFSLNEMVLFRDIVNKSDKIEYQYFYWYLLGDEIKYPIYTTKQFLAKNQRTRDISKRHLYIVWKSKLIFLFSWADSVIALFIITHISFAVALVFEKVRRETNKVVVERQSDETDSLIIVSEAQKELSELPEEKDMIDRRKLSRDVVTPTNTNTNTNTNADDEEILEAISLN